MGKILKNNFFVLILAGVFVITSQTRLFSVYNSVNFAQSAQSPHETKIRMIPTLSTEGRASDVTTVHASHMPLRAQGVSEPFSRQRILSQRPVQAWSDRMITHSPLAQADFNREQAALQNAIQENQNRTDSNAILRADQNSRESSVHTQLPLSGTTQVSQAINSPNERNKSLNIYPVAPRTYQ